jgi:hypothetical protein
MHPAVVCVSNENLKTTGKARTLIITSGLLTQIGTVDTQIKSARKYKTVVC